MSPSGARTPPGAIGRAKVITVSTRAAAGIYEDTAGPIAADALRSMGFDVGPVEVVADGAPLRAALASALSEDGGADCIVTAGGTGLNPADETPQITRQFISGEVPGIAELIRASSWDKVPAAALSRGIAGVAGTTLIVNLPGSAGGVRDGMAVLARLLPHAIDQLRGRDHVRIADSHTDSLAAEPEVGESQVGDSRVAESQVGDSQVAEPSVRRVQVAHAPARLRAERGRSGTVELAEVTDQEITVSHHEQLVSGRDRGAVVGFGGVVRNHDHGRDVIGLEYVGHPSTGDVLGAVAAAAAAHPGVSAVAVSHRLGNLGIGDVALACAVSAAHRRQAFETCGWLIDEVKRRLPVWKRQDFADGTHEWVHCP